jgi:phosphoenolpyruvate-protein kinase (PTS system EI component)
MTGALLANLHAPLSQARSLQYVQKLQYFVDQLAHGFSIGSNDLTQRMLGLDRDSALVAHLFDELNEVVQRIISDRNHPAARA